MPPPHADLLPGPIAGAVWAPLHVEGRGDGAIARLALAQRRVASREQLRAAGINRGAIRHRLKVGLLHRQSGNVYLLGPGAPPPLAAETAAILHFNGHAVLSHRTAAYLWGLIDTPPAQPEVTIVGQSSRRVPGLTVHRSTTLEPRDVRLRENLPVTSPARTLVDCAGELTRDELAQAVSIALDRGLTSQRELQRALRRWPGARGIANLRALVEEDGGAVMTRSWAERRLRQLLTQAELPQPLVNVRRHGCEVDFVWEEHKLILEVDGYAFHRGRRAFERDRRRDQVLIAAGYRVIRITARQLRDEPFAVIARLAQALAR